MAPPAPEEAMSLVAGPCKARPVSVAEGLLVVLGVVAGGSVVVYAVLWVANRL